LNSQASERAIVHAMRGKEFIEYDNPFDVGHDRATWIFFRYHAMMDSDLC